MFFLFPEIHNYYLLVAGLYARSRLRGTLRGTQRARLYTTVSDGYRNHTVPELT